MIRASGPMARNALEAVFRPAGRDYPLPPRTAIYGAFIDPHSGRHLDDGLALFMPGPATYTGEDVVEISLHGSPTVLDAAMAILVSQGLRPASRGEFTRRAFLSGKLDLLQAEAVVDLIEAASPAAAEEAMARLSKGLSSEIGTLSSALKDVLAELEAYIDFEDDDEIPQPAIAPRIRGVLEEMEALGMREEKARLRRDGLHAAIVGKPNVGKSSLFNALVEFDRAIVTPHPGTTRDTIDARITLEDVALILSDTAGMREKPDPIEEQGIQRSFTVLDEADLAVLVLDASRPPDRHDELILDACGSKDTILVLNKIDLGQSEQLVRFAEAHREAPSVQVSATTGRFLDELKQLMARMVSEKTSAVEFSGPAGLGKRAVLLLQAASRHLQSVCPVHEPFAPGPEIMALEIRAALDCLGEITGEQLDDGVLDRVFERFCIGK